MADLDAVRLEAEQVRDAEQLAIAGLAGYLREATESLPAESALCRIFLIYSERFEGLGWRAGQSSSAALSLVLMEKEVRRQQEEEE